MKGRARGNVRPARGANMAPPVVKALALCLAVAAACRPPAREKAPPPPTSVTTYRAARGTLARTLEAVGHVEGWQAADLRPEVDGRLESLHFREGEQVAAGALLARMDPQPAAIAVAAARAAVQGGLARRALSRLALDRQKKLRASNLNAAADLDLARATLDGDEATLAAAQAQLAQAQLTHVRAEVRAPFAGVAGLRRLSPGSLVRAADPNAVLLTLVEIQPAAVLVSVPEDVLGEVRAALAAGRRGVDLVARDGARSLAEGTLWGIDNQIAQSSGTVRLKVRADNVDGRLCPGQFVRARLRVGWREGVVMVPREAVGRGEGAVVWIVGSDGRAAERLVEVGAEAGGWSELTAGVAAGEEVVLLGQHLLRPGAKVAATPAAAAALPPPPSPP